MAVGDEDSLGLSLSDALAVLKGHVPDGYRVFVIMDNTDIHATTDKPVIIIQLLLDKKHKTMHICL